MSNALEILDRDFDNIPEFDALSSISATLVATGQIDEFEEGVLAANEIDLTIPQYEYFECEAKYPLFVAGMGSGKSSTLALLAVRDIIEFPGADVAVYAPTFDLLSLILVPYISSTLESGGYTYRYKGDTHIFFVEGRGRIICRSLDNPGKIVGYETFRAHVDELDTLKLEKAEAAWNKIIARNRQKVYKLDENGERIPKFNEDGTRALDPKTKKPQFEMHLNRVHAYTTPEGWNFAYKRWIKEKKPDDGYEMIVADTYSNQHNLPPDYIDNLLKSYPPELADAYVRGIFTNLTAGRVYRNFCRKENASTEVVKDGDILHIGMDFNIEHGSAIVFVERESRIFDGEGNFVGIETTDHAVDEVKDSYDTDDTIRVLKERYPNHEAIIYPDASGSHRSTGASNGVSSKGVATATDLYKLRQVENWHVSVEHTNPPIKDSVNSVSARVCNLKGERRLFVNIEKCPSLVETFEQQTWKNGLPDKSTGLDHMGDSCRYVMYKKYPPMNLKAGYLNSGRSLWTPH